MVDANAVIKDFKQAIAALYGDRLDKIILYGSRARGDNREDSDFDFAVVLKDEKISLSAELKRMTDVIFPLELKYNADISFKPINDKLLSQPDKVYYYFLRTEGKII